MSIQFAKPPIHFTFLSLIPRFMPSSSFPIHDFSNFVFICYLHSNHDVDSCRKKREGEKVDGDQKRKKERMSQIPLQVLIRFESHSSWITTIPFKYNFLLSIE